MTSRNRYLLKNYGITEKQYTAQLKTQGNCCALCKKHKSEFSYSLHQDHNHKSGKNRGIVCFYCNKFRIARNNLESAKAIYDYMVKYD